MYVRYLRKKNRVPYGVVVALPENEGGGIGLSLCAKNDMFHRSRGKEIALGRAKKHSEELSNKEGYNFLEFYDDGFIGPEAKWTDTKKALSRAFESIDAQKERMEASKAA